MTLSKLRIELNGFLACYNTGSICLETQIYEIQYRHAAKPGILIHEMACLLDQELIRLVSDIDYLGGCTDPTYQEPSCSPDCHNPSSPFVLPRHPS